MILVGTRIYCMFLGLVGFENLVVHRGCHCRTPSPGPILDQSWKTCGKSKEEGMLVLLTCKSSE